MRQSDPHDERAELNYLQIYTFSVNVHSSGTRTRQVDFDFLPGETPAHVSLEQEHSW
jgi:hypothetical protein